jgi:hypothetical protein
MVGAARTATKAPASAATVAERNLRFGWWALLAYLTLGIGLELLHAFKVRWYLDVGNEARRLLFTLAHAHGVLVALVNIAFGATLRERALAAPGRLAAPCLLAANVLLPLGFALGGVVTYGGDPGPGILLVPVGAALLFAGVLATALELRHE